MPDFPSIKSFMLQKFAIYKATRRACPRKRELLHIMKALKRSKFFEMRGYMHEI